MGGLAEVTARVFRKHYPGAEGKQVRGAGLGVDAESQSTIKI
jgi:hypothetical protein